VLREGSALGEADIIRYCARHLEPFKLPKRIEFHASLPKTVTGKIKNTGFSAVPSAV
jgi:long-chain acyl-CoA synthetase